MSLKQFGDSVSKSESVVKRRRRRRRANRWIHGIDLNPLLALPGLLDEVHRIQSGQGTDTLRLNSLVITLFPIIPSLERRGEGKGRNRASKGPILSL